MEKIYVIVVHHENKKDTIECLHSLDKVVTSKDFSFQVLIVDNGSRQILELPKSLHKKKFEVIRSEANLGFTGGNNLGMHYVSQHYEFDYFLLLNNDTTVDPKFLVHLYNCAQNNLKAGLISAKIYFSKGREYHQSSYLKKELGSVLWFAGGSIDWPHLVAFHRGVDEVDRGHFDKKVDSDFVTGCVMLIPKNVFEQVGYLDKRYFLYLEDVDYSVRVKNHGFSLHVCMKSKVWHKNAGSSGSGSSLHRYYQERNRLFFALKFAPLRYKLTALKIIVLYLIQGSAIDRKAVVDLLLQNMGKQPLV